MAVIHAPLDRIEGEGQSCLAKFDADGVSFYGEAELERI